MKEMPRQEEYIIRDLETLKVISDSFRMRIMETMGSIPTTVKQIAQHLDVSPKKLYYHINLLEKHDLIMITHTQLVSGIVEKWYQVSARQYSIDRNLLNLEEGREGAAQHLDHLLNGIFITTRNDISSAIKQGLIHPDHEGEQDSQLFVSKGMLSLDDSQRQELFQELESLCERYKKQGDEEDPTLKNRYGFTIVVHPSVKEINREITDTENRTANG